MPAIPTAPQEARAADDADPELIHATCGTGSPSRRDEIARIAPFLRGAGSAGREICHPDSRQRQPGAGRWRTTAAPGGTSEPQAAGRVQGISLSGGQLEDGAAGGGESGASCRGVVPTRGIHRDQSDPAEPGGGAVLQQERDRRAVDQRRKAGGEDDTIELPSVSVERGEAMAERDRLQPGEPVAAAGAAEENRQLVAHQPAAEAGENRRPNDQARSVLLAAVGREPSDAPPLRVDGTALGRRFPSMTRRVALGVKPRSSWPSWGPATTLTPKPPRARSWRTGSAPTSAPSNSWVGSRSWSSPTTPAAA